MIVYDLRPAFPILNAPISKAYTEEAEFLRTANAIIVNMTVESLAF
jgi:hypothetical protein